MPFMNLNKLKSTNVMTNPLFIIIMLLLGLIIILAIFRSASPFLSVGFGVNAHIGELKGSFEIEAFDNAPDQSNDSDALFIMYYAEWCGHCKKTMPEFKKLMDSYNGNVKIIAIDSESEENKDLVKSQNIKGFPTIRYYPSGLSGDHQEYDGGRTQDDFMQYLNSL
jgi:thiol-disulfide isomerase/thioredoxin